MNNKLLKIRYIAGLFAGACIVMVPGMAVADWSLKILDQLGRGAILSAMNDSGQVVGYDDLDAGHLGGFITGPNGVGVTYLENLTPYGYTMPLDINNSGQVAGFSSTPTHGLHAFITGPNGVGTRGLGTLGGDRSFAYGINDSGQVVGSSEVSVAAPFYERAFITGPNGTGMTDLNPSASDYVVAYRINNSGQVTGWVLDQPYYMPTSHAFITGPNGVGVRDLGTFGTDNNVIRAVGINNSGQVVGYSGMFDAAGNTPDYFFVTGADGSSVITLDVPGYGSLTDINDLGQVIGNSSSRYCDIQCGDVDHAAFLYSDGGVRTDLLALAPVVARGWDQMYALAINNRGQSLGWGVS